VYDCFSTCDGNAIIDECGVCGGSGIPEGNCDCAGNVEDCAGVCGGSSVEDECGVCGGGGIPAGACDCAGNVNDECGECGGDGASVECSDGSYVCNEAMCGTDPDDFVMLWNEPYEIATTFVLDLSNSELTGEIPPEIGDLENLTHLDLSFNQLTGIIPPEIRDLTNLTHLDLSFNQLTGIIPPEIGDLTNLEVLNLGGNKVNGMGGLSGSIPHELAYLGNTSATGLTILWLFDNELSGDIPLTLGNLSSLTSLWLFNNELSGTIPWQIGADLTNLTNLDLSFNQLSGEIPLSIGYLADLTNLDLSFNQLSGEIPLSICDLTNLTIDLDNNQLCPHDFGTADAAYPSCIEDSVGSQDTSSCGECGAPPGDLNGDGGWNVIDIVTLANCAIANNCDELLCPNPSIPEECFYGCAGDVNGDGGYNVLDIVALANCILNNNCA